jgi:hypothetical protein
MTLCLLDQSFNIEFKSVSVICIHYAICSSENLIHFQDLIFFMKPTVIVTAKYGINRTCLLMSGQITILTIQSDSVKKVAYTGHTKHISGAHAVDWGPLV